MRTTEIINIYLLAQIVDVASTYIAIQDFDQTELNPFMALLFQNFGVEASLILKVLFSLTLSYLFLKKFADSKFFELSLKFISFIAFFISMQNTLVILLASSTFTLNL